MECKRDHKNLVLNRPIRLASDGMEFIQVAENLPLDAQEHQPSTHQPSPSLVAALNSADLCVLPRDLTRTLLSYVGLSGHSCILNPNIWVVLGWQSWVMMRLDYVLKIMTAF